MEMLVSLFAFGFSFASVVSGGPLAIVLMTVLVRTALLPLQVFTMRQQLKLKALQPKLEELKKEYAQNGAALLKKTTELKETSGIKSGALFLVTLSQLPLLLGFYKAIKQNQVISASALWWIPSLGAPDPIFLLPVLMGLAVYFQTPSLDGSSRVFRWLMSGLNLAFMAGAPAGVVLYCLTSSLYQIASQKVLERWVA